MTTSTDSPIFVFGSNLAGRHSKGAALHAIRHHGAVYGLGIGSEGRSYRYLDHIAAELRKAGLPE